MLQMEEHLTLEANLSVRVAFAQAIVSGLVWPTGFTSDTVVNVT